MTFTPHYRSLTSPPRGRHSTKNVHGPFEQSFSDPTLNEWLEILISTPKQGNWDKFRPLNAWNYYSTISLFLAMSDTVVRIIRIGFIPTLLAPFLSSRRSKFRLLAQFNPIGTLTTWISQENKPQTRGFSLPKFTPTPCFFVRMSIYMTFRECPPPTGGNLVTWSIVEVIFEIALFQ